MSWTIERTGHVALVRMTSSPVNKQNPGFFRDLQETFDRLDRDLPGHPVVLTGTGSIFSVGLDFDYTFDLFQRQDPEATWEWFQEFRDALLRVFFAPRPTVAAINGHAFAGGLLLALACDVRVAQSGPYRCGLNEVPVGIPMPSAYTELTIHRVGARVASEAILTGAMYDMDDALRLGFYDEIVAPDALLQAALERAASTAPDCLPAYAHSKNMLLAVVRERIGTLSVRLDRASAPLICSEPLISVQQRALAALKARKKSG